jgi:hypothetical protein
VCSAINESISFSHWPSLQSLNIGNGLIDKGIQHKVSLVTLIDALPSGLVELVATNKYGVSISRQPSLDLAVVSRAFSDKLPNLTKLNLEYNMAVPNTDEGAIKCQWPSELAYLSLVIKPTESDEVLELNLPHSLTHLSLSRPSNTNGRAGMRIAASSLPPSLVNLRAYTVGLMYDAPLPSNLVSLDCRDVSPEYSSKPFDLPPSITFLSPDVHVPFASRLSLSSRFRPNILIMSLIDQEVNVPVLDDEAEQEWMAFEKRFAEEEEQRLKESVSRVKPENCTVMTTGVRELVALTYVRPTSWSKWESFKQFGLLDVLVPRIARTLREAEKVAHPSLVDGLLSHAKWLTEMRLSTAVASVAFVQYALDSINGKRRMPHLLENLTMCLVDIKTDVIDFLNETTLRNRSFQLPGIRSLTLKMSVYHITCLKFQLAIPRLFPNLKSLTIRYSGLSQGKLKFYPVSEYKMLLDGLTRLKELEILPDDGCHVMHGFSQTAEAYVIDVPSRIKTVVISSGPVSIQRVNGLVLRGW